MRKHHEQRREEIAAAALELLAQGGPRELTARNLGARVGMDGSSLFRHFENKAEILHAALDQFEAVLTATIPATTPSWESLRTFFVQRLSLVQARPEILRLAFNQHLLVVSGESEHTQRVREVVKRSIGFINACLEAAQRDGVISSAVPASAQVWVVTGMLQGAALRSMLPALTPDGTPPDGAAPDSPTQEQAWQWLAATLHYREPQPHSESHP